MFSSLFSLLVFFSPALATPRAEIVARVLATHPELTAANLRSLAASGDPASGASPLLVTAGLAPLSLGQDMPGFEVDAQWALPALGMQQLEREQLGFNADASRADEQMRRIRVAAETSAALDQFVAARAEEKAASKHVDVLAGVQSAVERRTLVGLAPVEARVMAEMETVQAESALLTARRKRVEAEAVMTYFLGDEAGVLQGLPDELGPVLYADLAEAQPGVSMAEADVGMASAMASMELRKGRPMVALMGSYATMWDDEMHRLMVGTMLSVPLDTKVRALRTSAALDRKGAAERDVALARRKAAEEIATSRAMVDESRAMALLATDRMLPLAVEAARLARVSWESGKGSLVECLRAENERVQTETMVYSSQFELRRAEAMLAMALGQPAGLPAQKE